MITSVVTEANRSRTDSQQLGEAIHQAVTGDFRGHGVHKQFIQRGEEDAYGGHCRLRGKVVVGSLDLDTAFPAPGEGANFDGRFGIHRDAQDIVCRIGGVVDLGYLLEDRVGFRDFFVADFSRLSSGSTLGH